jgi:hypothetical protein|tara:strand:+ start:757 stop:1434 length:678 start_codon:yes stop_codon:yes gene_type:complete
MKSEETTTTKKSSLFDETRVSKDFKTTLTPGKLKSSAQISREKPTDQEWFQVWGNSIDELEEMAIVKIPVGQREEDYIIRGTKKFKDDAKNSFKKVRMCRVAFYVTSNGRPGLWMVSIPSPNKEGYINAWTATANEIVEMAQHKWVKKQSNMPNGYYEGFYAREEDQQIFGEPDFRFGYEEAISKSFDKFFITEETIETDPHLRVAMGTPIDLKTQKLENRKVDK